MIITMIMDDLESKKDDAYAKWAAPLLQITEGGYGENDNLYGIRTPELRKISKKYCHLSVEKIEELLHNSYHEARMLALLLLIYRYKHKRHERENIVNIYLNNADYINNWDLVDNSAPNILGEYILENEYKLPLLYKLSQTNHLWKERIAIVATKTLIKHGFYEATIKLSEKYLTHPHHLIHKATGWMLRELGKKNLNELYSFLDKYSSTMPRVMLRYAIERLPDEKRKYYMTK